MGFKTGREQGQRNGREIDRIENCEKLLALKVNPEIWEKLTHYG